MKPEKDHLIAATVSNESLMQFYNPPPPVGCWQIGGATGLSIGITKKPRWLTRLMCRWLFEMTWIDKVK